MTCPFALFNRTLSSTDDNDIHHSNSSSSSIAGPSQQRLKLTSALKSGTWKAHREIEKSAGVRALMGSHHAELAVRFDRMDHLNFIIMLGCIYLTMEDVLFNLDSTLRDMMPLLFRSDVLLDDIQVHLDEILSSKGASVSELDHTADEEAASLHRRIADQITIAQTNLQRIKILRSSSHLTANHIALLTKRQAHAVCLYLDQIASLSSSRVENGSRNIRYDEGISFTPLNASPSDKVASKNSFISRPTLTSHVTKRPTNYRLILAHAYVRYMGDLSGGQHIVKQLFKLFPIYDADAVSKQQGFRFYSFASTGRSNQVLKEMIRDRLNTLDLDQSEVNVIVDEASKAFLLNGKLLDSLVDETDTISTIAIGDIIKYNHRISLSSLSLQASLKRLSLYLYNSHTLALIAASLLFAGLASALFTSAH